MTRPPREIYRQELAKLENHFQILEKI
ncbi:MAG: hypothetical protein MUP55_02565 [Candidatus Aenigmarchaeota archaeon]|nr:hypothetical protein [Candidatus Aenigmarchaeota archaeon]